MSPAKSASLAAPKVPPAVLLLVAVFFTLGALMLILPELLQLVASQRAEYHFGEPPNPLALASGGLALLGVAVLGWRVSRHGSAPLWAAGLVLLGAVGAMATLALGDAPAGRTWASADMRILEVSRELQQHMLERLKVEGKLPSDLATWEKMLAETSPKPSPARTRSFQPVPYRVVLHKDQFQSLDGLAPGTLAVWVNPEGDYFELTPVGFSREGRVAPLADDKGDKVVLRGGLAPSQEGVP